MRASSLHHAAHIDAASPGLLLRAALRPTPRAHEATSCVWPKSLQGSAIGRKSYKKPFRCVAKLGNAIARDTGWNSQEAGGHTKTQQGAG